MTKAGRWAEGDVRIAFEMKRAGFSHEEIAQHIGRPLKSVNGKIWRGEEAARTILKRTWTPEEDKRLAGMKERGRSTGEIAKALDRTVAAVATRIAKLGERKLAASQEPRIPLPSLAGIQTEKDPEAYMKRIGVPRDYFA